ncbi:LOW QUALITY PROTEIN: cathepsin L-like peptidase [Amphiura filiformis]|uniref:LOW QUALITY PROTEIN: cathepsin L-like peptidase n=1 Tax=Amphiura filiformis TaxID=82378 RepID=UPI003B227FD9
MTVFELLIAAFFFAASTHAVHSYKADPSVPKFADAYHATGTLQLPYAELNEPFEIYFNGTRKCSWVSMYNGIDMVFNRGDLAKGGAVFSISPTVKDSKVVPKYCFLINGTKDHPVMPQSWLPDLTGFKYGGVALEDGQKLDMWVNTTTIQNRTNKYTFYTSKTKPVKPARYVMMGYDSLIGSHFDKYIVDYDTYEEPSSISAKVFDVPEGLKCGSFPGPGIEKHIVANPYQEVTHPERGDRYAQLFDEFKEKHDRKYGNDREHSRRQVTFTNNVRFIHAHNRKPLSYKLAINPLADRHADELRRTRGRLISKGYNGGLPFDSSEINPADVPDAIDWNLIGAVSQVKDQATCGSCWSFGSTGAIEGAYYVKNKKMVRFSQQNLMDCSWEYGNNGCNGGEEYRSYQYIIDHKGLMTEEDYGGYLGQNGQCHFDASKAMVKIKSYTNVTSGDQDALKKAIGTLGPVAVGIDASRPTFSFYSHGVYYDKNCGNTTDDLDHAVLAVGYGEMDKKKYWLIKNSWSTYWGNNGYVMIDWKDNNCGVASDATFVTLE